MKEEVLALKKDVITAELAKQSVAVKFATLGFKNLEDSTAFVVTNVAATKHFGLLVDMYTVCAHVKKEIQGESRFFKRLEHIKKIKLGTNRDDIAMSYFDNPIPALFTSQGEKRPRQLNLLPDFSKMTKVGFNMGNI